MNDPIKSIPYKLTKGSKRFKKFYEQEFKLDMLYPINNDKSSETLFLGWKPIDSMIFTNDVFTLEFYPTYYVVVKNEPRDSIRYMMSIPRTLGDFINDIYRFDIKLYWNSCIDEMFEPGEYLNRDEIKNYFANLLGRMGKSDELK